MGNKVHYNRGDEIIEIIVRDSSGQKMDIRRSNKLDDEENGRWLKWLMQKYGVRFKFDKSFLDIDTEFFKM